MSSTRRRTKPLTMLLDDVELIKPSASVQYNGAALRCARQRHHQLHAINRCPSVRTYDTAQRPSAWSNSSAGSRHAVDMIRSQKAVADSRPAHASSPPCATCRLAGRPPVRCRVLLMTSATDDIELRQAKAKRPLGASR